jgi:hypothetical protein
MNSTKTIINDVKRNAQEHSSVIFTGIGIGGVVMTLYLSTVATVAATRTLDSEPSVLTRKEKLALVWRMYIPATVSVVATVGCIIGGTRLGTKKTATAYSLLAIGDRAFDEYRQKVVEQHGTNNEQKVRDSIASDRVLHNPPETIVLGSGTVLCFDSFSGRYFMSDMETLRRAQNIVNAKLLRDDEATLDDFYHLVGLAQTTMSSNVGWASPRLLELRFSTVLSEDGRPCISFDFNYSKPI